MSRSLALMLAALAPLAAGGCVADDAAPAPRPPPTVSVLRGDLDTDIRGTTHLELSVTGTDIAATATVSQAYSVLTPLSVLKGAGHVEAFPEADMTLYTARFDAPPAPGGFCGAEPVSLALSLHRRGSDAHVGGALTAYCGKGTWHGVPPQVLRLAGDLPLP